MGAVKKLGSIFFNKKAYKKMLAYSLLILFLYVFSDFLGVFILTFILAYLFYSIANFIQSKLVYLSENFWLFKIPFWIIIVLEYILFVWVIIFLVANIVPSIQKEVESISKWLSIEDSVIISKEWEIIITDNENEKKIKSGYEKIIEWYEDTKNKILNILLEKDPNDNLWIRDKIVHIENSVDFGKISTGFLGWVKALGSGIWKILLALILSFIFIIDRKKLAKYLYQVKESNMWFFYSEYELLLDKVMKSFWLILKAQSMIALINATITMIGFYIIGLFFGWFPYIITLTFVVFFCSFIPILWMWLSAIPLVFIGYINWWIEAGLFVIMMVFSTTAFEAYYLNPKIVSSLFKLPMSLTFVILFISWKMWWIIGLLLWISLFYFAIWLLGDFNQMLEEKKNGKIKKFFTKDKKELI